jgi:DNA polymerase-3 subunit epsilon
MNVAERQQLLRLPIDAVPFVLLDVESTGLEPQRGDRICEIAMLRWQCGVQLQTFQTLIDPGRTISPSAFAVNQISADALSRAPTFAAVCDQVLEQLSGAVLVAHNAPFDVACLDVELLRLGRPHLANPLVDTLQLARSFLNSDRYNLGTLAQALGVARPSHRAMSDVLALKEVFVHLLNRLSMLGVTTLDDLLRAQRGLLPGQPEPHAPAVLLTALREGRRLQISYRTGGGDPVPRMILPLELQQVGDGIRMVAFCYLRSGQRTFYLDRITELALADQEPRAERQAQLAEQHG